MKSSNWSAIKINTENAEESPWMPTNGYCKKARTKKTWKKKTKNNNGNEKGDENWNEHEKKNRQKWRKDTHKDDNDEARRLWHKLRAFSMLNTCAFSRMDWPMKKKKTKSNRKKGDDGRKIASSSSPFYLFACCAGVGVVVGFFFRLVISLFFFLLLFFCSFSRTKRMSRHKCSFSLWFDDGSGTRVRSMWFSCAICECECALHTLVLGQSVNCLCIGRHSDANDSSPVKHTNRQQQHRHQFFRCFVDSFWPTAKTCTHFVVHSMADFFFPSLQRRS